MGRDRVVQPADRARNPNSPMPLQCNRHATPSDSSKAWQWARHHTGSVVASSVDFTAMVMVVQIFRASPVAGTAVGALCGALTSFLLGRAWVFRHSDMAPTGQAFRYAMVACASLGLNVLGEYLFVVRAGLGYLGARVMAAVLVSNLWNYPLHKHFVFGSPPRAALSPRR